MCRVLAGLLLLAPAWAARIPDAYPSGFEHFYNLEYDQASCEFRAAGKQNPDVPEPYNSLASCRSTRERLSNRRKFFPAPRENGY
jgi:hypothetical protein